MEIEKIQVGQIWRENDKRFDRFVRIEGIDPRQGRRSVAIRTVKRDGDMWLVVPGSRLSYADPKRFGRGYKLHRNT